MSIIKDKNKLKTWYEQNNIFIINTFVNDDSTFLADVSFNKNARCGITTKIEETKRFGTTYAIIINGESQVFAGNEFGAFTKSIKNILEIGKVIEYTDIENNLVCSLIIPTEAEVETQTILNLTKRNFDFGDKCVEFATCYDLKGNIVEKVKLCNSTTKTNN